MAESGINSLRMVIPGEFERGVEPEIGMYNPAFLKPIDEVFEVAEKLGIQIILCLFDSTSFYASWAPDEYWKYGIYSTKFSGPKEVFSNVELRQLMKNRATFLVNHFSHYSNIFAWEIMNEMNKIGDLFGEDSERVTMEWYNNMASSIKKVDPNHLITGSLYGDEVWESLNLCNNNDFIQIHTYDEELEPARISEIITKYCVENKKYNKPIIISEFASKKSNPLRNQFVQEGLLAAQKQGCSAWLYASVWDSDAENGMGHGDMNEELFEVYKENRLS
jgi:endo-1,4-beta-mannosidase